MIKEIPGRGPSLTGVMTQKVLIHFASPFPAMPFLC